MKTEFKIELIKGEFSSSDTKEILLSLLMSKLQFHQMRNFSLKERTGKSDTFSEQRITELTNAKTDLLQFVETNSADEKQMKIVGTITIEVI